MHEPSYLIGRLLKVSDDLHALYCEVVREKDKLPPQLIGNAVFQTALNNPIQALSLLAGRFRPYQAWARTNHSTKAGLSRWLLRQYAEIVAELQGQKLPERLTDTEKAQLFLGYLSGNPPKAESDEELSEEPASAEMETTNEGKEE